MAQQPNKGLGHLIFWGFCITHRNTRKLGRATLYEWSARRRGCYLLKTTHTI